MRILGVDFGSHSIGLAISDELGLTAQGLNTIRRKQGEQDFKEISAILSSYKVERIVVGLPRNMDGTLGAQAEKVFQWIKAFEERFQVPVSTWDERLSTVEANKILLEADLSRRKRKGAVDKLAAVLILQGYLDRLGKQNDEPSSPA